MKEKKRFGKFYIPFSMINNNIMAVRVIMSRIILIVKASMIDEIQMAEYVGQSVLFDEIEPTPNIPEYIMSINEEGEVVAERGECIKKSLNKKEDHNH